MKFKLNKLLIFRLALSHGVNSRLMYNNLKKDDFARPRTTLLGKRAFRHILCFALFTAVAIASIAWAIRCGQTAQIFTMILGVVLGVYAGAYGILFLPLAVNLTIKQLRLNKKAIGWIDLLLLIFIIIAFVCLIVFLKMS